MRARRRSLRHRRPGRPAAGGVERLRPLAGRPRGCAPSGVGPTSVTVPGCVAGWADLAGRFSRLGLQAALEPAILAAESGVVIAPRAASLWRAAHAELDGDAAACFELRDPFTNPQIARALRAAGDGSFYTGAVVEAIASVCWLSADDLAGHRNDWVEPIPFRFGDHTLLELPPNGQGSIAGWALEALADDLGPPAQVEALADAYRGDMPGSVGRRTPVPRTPRGWRYR